MQREKVAALEAIRAQLGNRIHLGSDLLEACERDEVQVETGLAGLNRCLGGGLPKGQLTEIVSTGGGGLVMAAMLAKARRERRYVVLFEVGGGLVPESFPEEDLEVLLWVGCASPQESLKGLDIASRDENFDAFWLDWRNCQSRDWGGIRQAMWHRILGQLREKEAAAVLFARERATRVAKRALRVVAPVSCDRLDEERSLLWEQLRFEVMLGS